MTAAPSGPHAAGRSWTLSYPTASVIPFADRTDKFTDCFAIEVEPLHYVRQDMGLTNLKIMIPFVRTLTEAEGVIDLLASHNLRRGETGCR